MHTLAEITGNLLMESKIRDVLKQLYKKGYRRLQYFLDSQSPLSYYPVQTKEENNTKPCKCVFIGHDNLQRYYGKAVHRLFIVAYLIVFNVEVFKFHTYSPVSMYIGTQTNVITYQMCILLSKKIFEFKICDCLSKNPTCSHTNWNSFYCPSL